MNKETKTSLILFLISTICGTLFIGFLMSISPGANSPYALALTHTLMLIPAFSCISGKLFVHKKETPAFSFYIFFLVITVTWIVTVICDMFMKLNLNIQILTTQYAIFFSVLGYMFLLSIPENERLSAGLSVQINFKKSLKYILLFMLLYVCATRLRFFVDFMLTGNQQILSIPVAHWERLPLIIFNFFIGYIVVFGEEYGWRYFLQPICIQKFGTRKGIFIVGIIWSIFHIVWDIIALQQPLYSIFFRFVVCISLSFCWGWIYFKTQNIWCIAAIHHLNNAMSSLWDSTHTCTPQSILVWLFIFFPFILLFQKNEYKK